MIDTAKLKGLIVERGYTQKDVAKMIGVSPKTFRERMKRGVFGSDEIEIMMNELKIDNPMKIFFINK